MAEMESDVIEHLIELENQASSITQEAREKALKKVNSAKAAAEQEYLEKFNAASLELENSFKAESEKLKSQTSVKIDSYKTEVSDSKLDTAAFYKLMDSLVVKK